MNMNNTDMICDQSEYGSETEESNGVGGSKSDSDGKTCEGSGVGGSKSDSDGKTNEFFLRLISPAKSSFENQLPIPPAETVAKRSKKIRIRSDKSSFSTIPPAKKYVPRAAGESAPPAAAKYGKSIIPAAGEHSLLLQKLYALYAKKLSSGVPGTTCVCHYQGLYGLASSYHALPAELTAIIRSRAPQQWEKDVVVAYGYQIMLGQV